MITPEAFYQALKKRGAGLFVGVPDSLLKHFCAYMDTQGTRQEHIITANEGNALALAAGYHLATGSIGAVYMQNSGLGNCVNPLTSLVDPEVYSIPVLLIIGWRGEPGVKDEPQHVKQGRITPGQLELLEIPYRILDAESNLENTLNDVFAKMHDTSSPAALLVRKNTFSECESSPGQNQDSLTREQALDVILDQAGESVFVSTTGKTSREVYELRAKRGEPQQDFLTVGSMGHTLSIALGVALGNPFKQVICLDGDGSALMHMGSIPVTGSLQPANLLYVLINNQAHESVGGQPTVAGNIDFKAMALSCGFNNYQAAEDTEGIKRAMGNFGKESGPWFLEIKVRVGSRKDLGRPGSSPLENKQAFIHALRR